MLKIGIIWGCDIELNIYGHYSNRHNGYLDYGFRRAYKVYKKEGRKKQQPQKTNRTHVSGNVIHDFSRSLIHSEYPVLK